MPSVYTTDEAYSAAEVDATIKGINDEMDRMANEFNVAIDGIKNEIRGLQEQLATIMACPAAEAPCFPAGPWQAHQQKRDELKHAD